MATNRMPKQPRPATTHRPSQDPPYQWTPLIDYCPRPGDQPDDPSPAPPGKKMDEGIDDHTAAPSI